MQALSEDECMVGTISLPSTGTMSGIVCSPSGEVFASKGPVIWQVDRDALSVIRYAGQLNGTKGLEGHRLDTASFRRARGMSFTDKGFFVVDTDDSRISEIRDDYVVHFAGTGDAGYLDGPRLIAQFRHPCSIVCWNDTWIVSDTGNQRIRFISPDGTVTSIGGGPSNSNGAFETATFTNPCMLCLTPRDTVLCTDGSMHLIREINMNARVVTTMEPVVEDLSFQLSATSISSGRPTSKLKPRKVAVQRFAHASIFQCPLGMAFDSEGFLYLANYSDHSILKIDYDAGGRVQTFIGGTSGHLDGPCSKATTKWPNYLCLTPEGDIYWTEHMDSNVRYALRAVQPMVPRIVDAFNSFAERLENLTGSDSPLSLPGWATPLYINQNIISTACGSSQLFDMSQFTSGTRREVVRTFLAILYGEHSAPNPTDVQECADYLLSLQMIHNLPLHEAWKQHADLLAYWALQPLSLPLLIQVLTLVSSDLKHDDRAIQPLAAKIRAKEDQVKEELKRIAESKISPELFELVFGPIVIPFQLNKIEKKRTSPLTLSLRTLGERLAWTKTFSLVHGPSHAPTNFVISDGAGKVLPVHDWVLYSRWPYFRSLIVSGLSEALSGTMELPSQSIPSSTLLQLMQFMYYGTVFDEDGRKLCFEKESDCEWVLENGAQFSIFSDIEQTQPSSGFESLVQHCKRMVTELS